MDAVLTRLREDLAGVFHGEVRTDEISQAVYASDASLFQVVPRAVCFPHHRDDVITLTRYARDEKIPLIARGAGTGLAGESLGPGIVVDFARHMHRVISIDEQTVTVEPGIVLHRLNELLRPHGRYFAPDPSNSNVTTIGGMLGVDAAGSHSIRVGSTRDHVEQLEIVLADGTCRTLGCDSISSSYPMSEEEGIWQHLPQKLQQLLQANADLILERQPATLFRNRAGYFLRGVLDRETINWPRLLVGSEGTLALVTQVRLHTMPLPSHRGVVLLLFHSVEAAASAVAGLAVEEPSACDLLDRRILTLARELDLDFARLIPATTEAALIVEQTGFSGEDVQRRLDRLITTVPQSGEGAGRLVWLATAPTDVDRIWMLAHRVVPSLNRLRGETRPLPFVEDIAVPPSSLTDFLLAAQRVFQRHQVVASVYAHAAAGQVHLRPFLPTLKPESSQSLVDLSCDLYDVALELGGTVSGEHGAGLARSPFLKQQYGPLYRVMEQVKQLFDPEGLLNPYKVVTPESRFAVQHLRPMSAPVPLLSELQLQWTPAEALAEARDCNGCGACRNQAAGIRMCPFFRLDQQEFHAPRAKANALRALLEGTIPETALDSPSLHQLSRTCFNCKQCVLECPSHVNIPHLALQTRALRVASQGLTRTEWFLSRLHQWGRLGCRFSTLANMLLRSPIGRWVIEQTIRIPRQRKLPTFARKPFLSSAPQAWFQSPPTSPEPRPVIYFVDHYANFHDPALALAFGRIVQHHGLPFHVPPAQVPSGMALITVGDVDAARPLAQQNIDVLVEFARQGCPIVCTEPTAAVCLQQDYPLLIDTEDAQLVANHVMDAGTFLQDLHRSRRLRTDFTPVRHSAAYHTPCHLKALTSEQPLVELCRLIPGFQIEPLEAGCSGMAGTFGLNPENFAESLAMGAGLQSQLQSGTYDFGLTECSSCKMQMEQGTMLPTLHPLKLLALSYGLMPEFRHLLTSRGHRWTVT